MSRRGDLIRSLEGVRATLARIGAVAVLEEVERANAGEPVIPSAIANVATPKPETSHPATAVRPGRFDASPRSIEPQPSVDAPASRVDAAPVRIHGWSTRPEIAARVARYHRVQAGRDR